MNNRQIEYVLAIAECGSFSKAAQKLYISQPSLSKYITDLEKHMDTIIFDRSTSPIRLTYAGKLYVKAAMQISAINKDLALELAELRDTPSGKIIVGSSSFITSQVVLPILVAMKERFPHVEIAVVEAPSDERERATLKGDIDLFFTPSSETSCHLKYDTIFKERILLAVPPDHPYNAPGAYEHQFNVVLPALRSHPLGANCILPEEDFPKVNLSLFRDEPFAMLRTGLSLQRLSFKICAQMGFSPKTMMESLSIQSMRSMAFAGLGCTFIPESFIFMSEFEKHPVYYQVDKLFPVRNMSIAYGKDKYITKAMKAFITTTQDIFQSSVITND